MLKYVFLPSIEDILKVIVWNSNYVNLVNNNAIEINFDDFLLEVLYFFLVRENSIFKSFMLISGFAIFRSFEKLKIDIRMRLQNVERFKQIA